MPVAHPAIFSALAEVLCIPGRSDVAFHGQFAATGVYEVRFERFGNAITVSVVVALIERSLLPVGMLAGTFDAAIQKLSVEASS
jgi:hypothetical protein